MIQGFQGASLGRLAELYQEFAPAKFAVTPELLAANTTMSVLFDWGASCVNDDGFVAIKRSAHGLYKGPDQDTAHLSILAFRDPKVGVDLLAHAKSVLRDRGVQKLTFGTDSRHFFPGCPNDWHALRDFLTIEGFEEGAEVCDLQRDLADYRNPFPTPSGDELRPCTGDDLPALQAFFQREFPGRWKYDVLSKIETEEDFGIVFGLFHRDVCDGFALLQWEGCNLPIGGAVWNVDLGPNWGSLGPIGVSASLRGKGSGHALLGSALEYLKAKGARQTIIDWTTLVQFYGKHGFQPARNYRYFTLTL